MRQIHTLEPIYDENSRILILGTFPSVKSREANFYYQHPQNRFWKVLARVFDVPTPISIEDQKELLLRHNVALWDVIQSCDIIGSSDSTIQNVIPNDLDKIIKSSKIKKVYANGRKAFDLYQRYCFLTIGIEIVLLPSTSPANAIASLEKLVEIWNENIINGIINV